MSDYLKIDNGVVYKATLLSIPTEPYTGGKFGPQWPYEVRINGETKKWTPTRRPHDLMELANVQVGEDFTIEKRKDGTKWPFFINGLTYGDTPVVQGDGSFAATPVSTSGPAADAILLGLLKDAYSAIGMALKLYESPGSSPAPPNETDPIPF